VIKCPYCGNKWDYKGSAKHYATCPKCHKKVRLHPYLTIKTPLINLKHKSKNYNLNEGKVDFT